MLGAAVRGVSFVSPVGACFIFESIAVFFVATSASSSIGDHRALIRAHSHVLYVVFRDNPFVGIFRFFREGSVFLLHVVVQVGKASSFPERGGV